MKKIQMGNMELRVSNIKELGPILISFEITVVGPEEVRTVSYTVDRHSFEIVSHSPRPMPSLFREVHAFLRAKGLMRKEEIPSKLIMLKTLGKQKSFPRRFFTSEFFRS